MRKIKFLIWLLCFLGTNAQLTLETVHKKVNDLEVKNQNLNSKIHNLTNEIAETKENELSERLEDHPYAVLVLNTNHPRNKPMVLTFDGKSHKILLIFSLIIFRCCEQRFGF